MRVRGEILIFCAGGVRHQCRLACAEKAREHCDGQWAFARRLHGLGRGLDGFEEVRVLTFLLLRAVRVRMGMVVGHFHCFGVLLAVVWVLSAICSQAIISAITLILAA